MDQRQPQNTFPRSQDRPLIHNPNHPAAPQPQHPSFYAPPGSQQPAVQIPFSDPFSRRDPFLPAAQQQRRGSYGIPGRDTVSSIPVDRPGMFSGLGNTAGYPVPALQRLQQPHSGPPPPPQSAAPASSGAPNQIPYAYDVGRRRSLSGASLAGYYGGAPLDPPPPPPSFGARNMPPPSPPQQHHHPPSYATQHGLPPPQFPNGRDLPGFGPIHRPGSSMSISSMLGGENTSAPQTVQHSPPTASMVPSPSLNPMRPPSPRRAPFFGSRKEHGLYRRPRTPDKYPVTSSVRDSLYPTATSPTRDSSEHGRQTVAQTQQQYKPMQIQQPRQYQSSPNDLRESNLAGQDGSGLPPRPSSQPTGLSASHREAEAKEAYGQPFTRPSIFGPADEPRRYTTDHASVATASEPRERTATDVTDTDRPVTVQPLSHSLFSPPQEHKRTLPQDRLSQVHGGSLFWRNQVPENGGKDSTSTSRDVLSGLFRPSFRSNNGLGQPFAAAPSTWPDLLSRQLSATERNEPRPGQQARSIASLEAEEANRRFFEQSSTAIDQRLTGERARSEIPNASTVSAEIAAQPRAPAQDQHGVATGEEMQRQRSFLNVSPEANRRLGRASPLPQAVQGAQAQLVGPGGDPSIKSEFGRIFKGLGSGLGSVPPGNGTSTPSRQSPLPQRGGDVADIPDADGPSVTRTASGAGRNRRRVKDEDGKPGSESGDGRGTPGLGNGRANKRVRTTHPAHQHHHHPHSHHHHHHHHRPDEDASMFVPSHQTNPNPTPFHKFNSNVPQNVPQNILNAPTTHHHHHHHPPHPPHHHHHHAPKAATAVINLPRKPATVINNQPVLDQVKDLPRKHLGSQLYEPKLSLPSAVRTPIDARFGYTSQPNVIPRFDNGANCTFTIRVDRYFLTHTQREQICLAGNVWGTGIYTDDSDPIASAIHSGWIRGAWDEDVPENMLDVGPENHIEPSDDPELMTFTEVPAAGPIIPPEGMDCHITLLILPTLEKYAGSVRNGLRSRDFNGVHDGMSFMVHKIQFLKEASTRGEERDAEARKKRLKAALSLVSLFAGEGQANRQHANDAGTMGGRLAQAVA